LNSPWEKQERGKNTKAKIINRVNLAFITRNIYELTNIGKIMQECRNAGMQECRNAGMQEFHIWRASLTRDNLTRARLQRVRNPYFKIR
jgi:hypothetical protein